MKFSTGGYISYAMTDEATMPVNMLEPIRYERLTLLPTAQFHHWPNHQAPVLPSLLWSIHQNQTSECLLNNCIMKHIGNHQVNDCSLPLFLGVCVWFLV